MSHYHPGELPEETGELTQQYIDLFEGLALGDAFMSGEAARHLRSAHVPHGQLIEKLSHENESYFIETKTLHKSRATFIFHRGLLSMVYGGSFNPDSEDQVNSIKTTIALLGIGRKWLNQTLSLDASSIERQGYTDRGYGKHASKLGKQALKVLRPERRSTRIAKTAGKHLVRGLNLYQPEVGMTRYARKKKSD